MSSRPSKMASDDFDRALVLDDDEQFRDSLQKLLATQGLVVDTAATTSEAERYLASRSYQLVITDIYHPGEDKSGDEFIIELGPFMQGAKTIIITRTRIDTIKHLEKLVALGVTILEKGSHEDRLKDIIADTFHRDRDATSDAASRDQVAQLYQQAEDLLRQNDLDKAAERYREIVEILPNELEAYGRLRDVLERLGRTEQAKQAAAEIEKRFPAPPVTNPSSAAPSLESPIGPPSTVRASARESVPPIPSQAAPGKLNRAVVDDSPVLIEAGQINHDRLKARFITQADIETAAKLRGFASLDRIDRATLTPDGTLDFVGKDSLRESILEDRFSADTLRVLAVAEALRRKLNHLMISRTNVLFGMLAEFPDGLCGMSLNSLGISREAMLEVIARKLNRSGKRTIDLRNLIDTGEGIVKVIDNQSLARYPFTDNLRTTLTAASEQTREELQPDDIFVALIRSLEQDPGFAGWMLGKEKTEWVQKTLADWPDGAFTEETLRDKAIAAGLYSPASASSDAASKDDLLNFKQSASAMVNIVLKHDTVPPLVVGVYGPWGSGKSTYLELVKKGLLDSYDSIKKAGDDSKATNLLVVEYDAWSYSDAPKLWAGLITKIAKKLDEDLGWWGRIKYMFETHRPRLVGGILLGLIPVVIAVPVVLLGLLKPLSAGLVSATAGPLISIVSAWFAQREAVFGNVRSLASKFDDAPASGVINSIQDEFKDALESWIKQKTGADASDATIEQRVRDNNLKIVVFIDELDRCPLERIVDILEAIKLFLAKEIFIVFMAVDTRVASEAIRLKYKDVRNPDLPREYLEKIVQLPLRVPTARGKFLNAYLKKFMPNVKDDEPAGSESNSSSDFTPATRTGSEPGARPAAGAIPISGLPPKPAGAQQNTDKANAGASPKTPSKGFKDPSPMFLLPQLPDTKIELTMLATISEQFLESNPRKIKRLLNTYRYIKVLSHAQAEPVQSAEWQQTMLGWLAFTMTWPSFMAKAIEKLEYLEPKNGSILLSALSNIVSAEARPSETDVTKFLPVSGERLKTLWEMAGNFLIENADPGSASYREVQRDQRKNSDV